MMSVRTPAMEVSSILTGKRRRASADWLTRHSSVRLRRSASDSGPGVVCESVASHFWASGLTVEGMGTTRVMCAVPSGSKAAESCEAIWPVLLQPSRKAQIRNDRNANLALAMKMFPLCKFHKLLIATTRIPTNTGKATLLNGRLQVLRETKGVRKDLRGEFGIGPTA